MSARVKYVPRGTADVTVLQKMRARIKELEKALVRACELRGHRFHCSASRGVESECDCGWSAIEAMAKKIAGNKPTAQRRGEQP